MSIYVIVMAATSFFTGLDPAWIAFLGAAFGGAGLKLTEYWLGRNRVRVDDASQIRDELRTEITGLREENSQLETSRNEWREKYYGLQDTIIKYKQALANFNAQDPTEPS